MRSGRTDALACGQRTFDLGVFEWRLVDESLAGQYHSIFKGKGRWTAPEGMLTATESWFMVRQGWVSD